MNMSHYHKFGQLKNIDYFLVGLSDPILCCFSNSPIQFRNIFERPQKSLFNHPILVNFPSNFSNGIYSSNTISEKDQKIITIIEDFFWELMRYDCGCCQVNETNETEITRSFNEFVKNLLEVLDLYQLEQEVSVHTSPVFFQDYSSVLSDLFKEKHTLEQAQKSLLFWKDAISDTYLQKALLALHYRYIEYLVNYKYAPSKS